MQENWSWHPPTKDVEVSIYFLMAPQKIMRLPQRRTKGAPWTDDEEKESDELVKTPGDVRGIIYEVNFIAIDLTLNRFSAPQSELNAIDQVSHITAQGGALVSLNPNHQLKSNEWDEEDPGSLGKTK